MSESLRGRTIALAEGRQLEELATMLESEGATVLRYPLLSILDAPDPTPIDRWLTDLIDNRFDLVILMTGEAVRRLAGFAQRSGRETEFLQALARSRTVSRGPKPGLALRDFGLKPERIAPSPTTDGVLQLLDGENLAGKTVGLTLYGSENPKLCDYLTSRGAIVHTVMPYVFAAASDEERVLDLFDRLQSRCVDALVFTSSPQVDRLWEVAQRHARLSDLQEGLSRTQVAAVGPLVADALRQRGVDVKVCPEQGWVMKNLVRQLVRSLSPE